MKTKSISFICGLLALGATAFIANTTSAANLTWGQTVPPFSFNTVDSNWFNAQNWSSSTVPGNDDAAIIRGRTGVNHMPLINANAGSVNHLLINNNTNDVDQQAILTLDGPNAFLRVRSAMYINRSVAASNDEGQNAAIYLRNGGILSAGSLRLSAGESTKTLIDIGAGSEFRIWNGTSALPTVDLGGGDVSILLSDASSILSLTGDARSLIQTWIDGGHLQAGAGLAGLSINYYDAKNIDGTLYTLTEVTIIPEAGSIALLAGGFSLLAVCAFRRMRR